MIRQMTSGVILIFVLVMVWPMGGMTVAGESGASVVL